MQTWLLIKVQNDTTSHHTPKLRRVGSDKTRLIWVQIDTTSHHTPKLRSIGSDKTSLVEVQSDTPSRYTQAHFIPLPETKICFGQSLTSSQTIFNSIKFNSMYFE